MRTGVRLFYATLLLTDAWSLVWGSLTDKNFWDATNRHCSSKLADAMQHLCPIAYTMPEFDGVAGIDADKSFLNENGHEREILKNCCRNPCANRYLIRFCPKKSNDLKQ